MKADVLAVGTQQAVLVDGHLLVERLDHGLELRHVEDVGLPAVEPDEVLALELGPAGLYDVERRTYSSDKVSKRDDRLTVGRLELGAEVLVE